MRAQDDERRQRIVDGLRGAGLDAVVATLPANVLLLSGYWPVVGTSLAIATRGGAVAVLAPEDERDLAAHGWADESRTFEPASLEDLHSAEEAVQAPFAELASAVRAETGRIGCEHGPAFEPASYAALHLYGGGLADLLRRALPRATPVPADDVLARLRAVKSAREVERIRTACAIVGQAFADGIRHVRAGLAEMGVAAAFRTPLSTRGLATPGVGRADGFAWCMSGPNSARAFGAYARSRARRLEAGDLVLVHCNSCADGYWTDVTRTYCLGANEGQRQLYRAVGEARAAALAAIRPGVRASEVDRAARDVLTAHGFGKEFKHPTGHGVGFAAINHNARPRLHPRSDEVLEVGMVFNVEPAVYFEGYGGMRHCDVVAVTPNGVEVLTPFQSNADELVIASAYSA